MVEALSDIIKGVDSAFAAGGGGLSNPLSETEPSTPASGVSIFARNMGGRRMLGWKQPDADLALVQPHFGRNRVGFWVPNGGSTTITSPGMGINVTGATARTPASTNMFTQAKRLGAVSAATAGASAGMLGSGQIWWRGNAAGLGGFHFITRFGISHAAAVAQARGFVGFYNATSIGNVNPSTLTTQVGMQFDSAETTWRIGSNDASGTATRTDLGANFPTNTLSTDWYELQLYASPNGSDIGYRVERLNTAHVATGTLTTDLPANTTFLTTHVWINNGTTAAAAAIDCGSIYCEADN